MENLFDIKKIKTKMISVLTMTFIVFTLCVSSYILFLRVVEVDVTKDASITFSGESGRGRVKVKNEMKVYNQRIQEFMNSISYTVEPTSNLSNGDIVTVHATYDQELAKRYNLVPIAVDCKVKVKNLSTRYVEGKDIPQNYIELLEESSLEYIANHENDIITDCFSILDKNQLITIEEEQLEYRIFLKSLNKENQDKVVDIYGISASGLKRISEIDDRLEYCKEKIYYMVTCNEINTSNMILKENVYGEKVIVPNSYDLSTKEGFTKYLNDKYGAHYKIEILQE